jgi:hypothetical protein
MSSLPDDPQLPSEAPDLTPELRDYVLACLRAARPSRLRTQAIDAFTRSAPVSPLEPVNWLALETEAQLRGITLAELIAEQGTDESDPFAL